MRGDLHDSTLGLISQLGLLSKAISRLKRFVNMDTTSKHRMELRHVVFNFKSPKQPRKSQATYQAEYRNRLKSNRQKWETYKTKQKLYIQNYRNRLTQEEKKERQAKQTQRNREKRKAQKLSMESVTSAQTPEPPKRKTRMSVEETRAYWRDRKRRQREAMTKEQKQAVQRREYELYKLKRALSSGIHTQTTLAPTLSPPSEVSTPTGELPKKDTTNKYKMEPPHAVLNFKSPKQRRKSQATYQGEYRDRLKSNCQHWETLEKNKKLYQQSYQSILTEDEKREKQAKKNQRNREKRKAQKLSVKSVTPAQPSDPPKRKTRKSKEEKRVYWRNSKKLQGEVMTEEQKQVLKRQLNELCKIRRTLKSTDIHTQTTPALTLSPPIEISTPLVEMPKKDTTSKHRMELRHVVLNFKSPKQPRKSQATYQAEYRNRLKSNSQKWETYKTKQKLYIQNYRNRLTQEEKKERQAKQTQRNREKRKAQKLSMESVTSAQTPEPPKRKTRMSVEETRAYWRDRKRRQREAMTKEQKQAVQRREYELYKLKRALSSGIHTQTTLAPTLSPPSEVSTPTGELPKKDTTNKYKMEPPHAVLNFKSPKQRRKSQATYQGEYRDRLKSNCHHWETFEKNKKLYQQSYQSILTEDEKREKQAKKNQRNREKRKAQKLSVKSVTPAQPSDPPKRKTRKSKEEKRVYWRNSKKLQGEVMTEEQKQVLKRQLNELCKIRRTLKSTDIHTQTTPALTLSPPIEISTPLVEMPKKDTTSKHRMELRHVVLNFKSPKQPRKSQATYQAEYRNRLKSNRQKWETYKTKQKLYIQNYRNRLTQEEKKEKQAKQTQRNREKREAQKLSMESVTCAKLSDPPKRKTRKSVEDMRAYWRDKKRLEREAMTEEQKQAVRRRENEQYKLRKALKSTGIHAQTTSAPTLSPPIEIPSPAVEVLSQDQAALIHRLILASMHVAKLPTSTTIPVSIANKTCQTQVIEMS